MGLSTLNGVHRGVAVFSSISDYLLYAGSLPTGTSFVVLDSGTVWAGGKTGQTGYSRPALNVPIGTAGIDFSDISENSTYGYEVVSGSGGISRDGSNNLVLTANDSNPVVKIKLRLLGASGTIPLGNIGLYIATSCSSVEFGGGATSPWLNTRGGIRFTPTGVSSGAYAECVLSAHTATNFTTSINSFDGVSTYAKSNGGDSAFVNWHTLCCQKLTNQITSSYVPGLYASAAYGGALNSSYAAVGQGFVPTAAGWNFLTDPDQGCEYIEIYVDQQAAGKDMALTLKKLFFSPLWLNSPA